MLGTHKALEATPLRSVPHLERSFAPMHAFLLFLMLVAGTRLDATPLELRIPGAVSTKLDRELVLIPKEDEPGEPNALSVIVRHAKSHKIIASDTFFPFGILTEVDPRMRVAWSPTGEYVALNLRDTRHTTTTFIYRITKSGLSRIEIPFYWSAAQKILGADADFRSGIETPLRWKDAHTLVVRSQGTLRNSQSEFDLLVTIAFTGSKPSIQSVTPNK